MLDTKAWAIEKKELWMRDMSRNIFFFQDGCSLRECHRLWQSFLRQNIQVTDAASPEKASAALKLLMSRSLVKGSVRGELNEDGEDVIVRAGGDGWGVRDIFAAATAGADIGATDSDGRNCIWNAAQFGEAESIAALLKVKGDVNKCNSNGRSPIYVAARNGHADCLILLLAACGDVNKCGNDDASPIFIAAQKGKTDCLKLLLSAGGDVNKCKNDGTSPIYIATQKGNIDCLGLLLAAGGDINKCNNKGWSPIFIAGEKGHADCLKLLLASLPVDDGNDGQHSSHNDSQFNDYCDSD
jgi:ankyrin repeat protein